MPQLTTDERLALNSKLTGDDAAKGLVVYDTDLNCLEFWNGEGWISLCTSIAPPPIDPSVLIALPTGSGCLSGKAYFDIALTDNNADTEPGRGALSWRKDMPAATDFRNNISETYTFSPSGTVSKVRFGYVENAAGKGKIVQALTPDDATYASGKNINTDCTVNLTYKQSLYNDALGTTQANALKVDIYAVYNDSQDGTGTDAAVKLTATIKDAACCGAKISSCEWRDFMCHNLGANESVDPFTPSADLNGDYYQWGSKTPAATRDAIIVPWSSTAPAGVYGNGSTNQAVTTKSPTDPCPAGYRVPNYKEWSGVRNVTLNSQTPVPNTTWTANGWSGMMFNNSLFLPAAGYRSFSNGALLDRGTGGFYWNATLYSTTTAYSMNFLISATGMSNFSRANGYSIRCVAE